MPRRRLLVALVAMAGGSIATCPATSAGASPDPTGMAAAVEGNGLIAYDVAGDIWVVHPDGSGTRRLTSGPALDTSPSWSPDGTRLAYLSWPAPADPATDVTATPTGSVIVIDADGGEARPVVTGLLPGIGTQAGGVAWAPDGDHIAYDRRLTPDGPAEIDVLSVADPHPVTVVSPGEHPAWSPDGRMLAYRVPDTGVSVISADGFGARQLSSGWSAGDYESWAWPSWSPDGQWVTYGQAPEPSAGHDDIYVAAVDGSVERDIVEAPDNDTIPLWSPDGSRIAFGRVIGSLKGYALTDPDGAALVTLEGSTWLDIGEWAPDGTKLLANAADPTTFHGRGIVVFDVAGGPPLTIPVKGDQGHASWQPIP